MRKIILMHTVWIKGISANEVHQENPNFTIWSRKGILKIMIAQSTWYVMASPNNYGIWFNSEMYTILSRL